MTTDDQPHPSRRPFFLRFPEDLRQRLAAEAEAAERTLTSEVIFRLRRSLEQRSDKATAS